MIRLFIADDHPLIRAGFKQILLTEPDMQIVGEAGSGDELLEKIQEKIELDILLLDLNMPGKNGLDLLREVKQLCPKIHVLVVSMFPLEQYAVRVLRLGAAGYLCKDTALDELQLAIRTIMKRGKYISPQFAELLANEFGVKETMPHEALSDREFQILCMVTSGKTIRQIADELCLNTSTVNTYHARILEKMNMKTNVELTLYAVANHLIAVQLEA